MQYYVTQLGKNFLEEAHNRLERSKVLWHARLAQSDTIANALDAAGSTAKKRRGSSTNIRRERLSRAFQSAEDVNRARKRYNIENLRIKKQFQSSMKGK